MLTFASLAAALVVPTPLLASRLTLGPPIGSGNFGSVQWARVGNDVAVAKRGLVSVIFHSQLHGVRDTVGNTVESVMNDVTPPPLELGTLALANASLSLC